MYPGIIIEYDDQSDISSLPIAEVREQPLFCSVFTSDKGTEEWTRISGSDFFDMYGKSISFNKHGQPLLQAAMSINSGAELLCKRLVADDATLANIGIIAKVDTESEVQAKDADGNLLYVDTEGNQTVENTGEPLMTKQLKITYSAAYAQNISLGSDGHSETVEDARDAIKKSIEDQKNTYLLYVIADNGRGESKKRIKIIPNYKLSKTLDYTLYTLSVIEGSSEVESMTFSINPNLIVSGENISLQSMISTYSTQLTCIEDVDGIDAFIEALATATGLEASELYKYDALFGKTNRGEAISGVTVDTENGLDLQYTTGQKLEYGSNGSFGNRPFSIIKNKAASESEADAYTKAAIAAFDGSFDKIIFNVDQHKIDAVIDANYPPLVKRSIETLAMFREDFIYLRDQGIGKTSFELIVEDVNKEAKSMFCATYPQSYDIIDPYTKRQITVTIGYTLARKLVAHCNNGRILPPAGMKFDMIIDDAIYGTLSYAPTICPDCNEKEKLEELRVNYASYIDNKLVIESLFTSYERNSQWSYINNVMGIQEVVKAIRTRCPAIRYTFIDGEDLEKYKADVEEVISPFSSNYLQLSLEYVADARYSANKIFYAVLKVVYKDFIQTEWFRVTALSTVEVSA